MNELNQQAPTHQAPQIQEKSHGSRMMLFIFVIFGAVAILIGVGGYVLLGANKAQTLLVNEVFLQPSPTPIDETANWKTYTNEYFLIKFETPQNWSIKEYESEIGTEYELLSDDGFIKISSAIDNNRRYRANDNTFPKINAQLGIYNDLNYAKYLNTDDEVIYRVDLYRTFRQKDIFVYVIIKGDFEKNHNRALKILKTFAFTRQEPLLDEFFTYKVPSGWTFNSKDRSDSISLNSPDAEYDGGSPYLKKGAKIYISGGRLTKKPKDGISFLPDNEQFAEYKKQTISIGGHQGTNIFHCWEGCFDGHSVITDNYYVTINFNCTDFCNTKASTDASVYAKDRDYFINSIKFK